MTPARFLVAAAIVSCALPAGAGKRPRYGGAIELAVPQPIDSLDPIDVGFASQLVHQPPLRRLADGRLAPVLLEQLPVSRDGGRTFLLELRQGLRFHDGRPVRAADLEASLKGIIGEIEARRGVRFEFGPRASAAVGIVSPVIRSAHSRAAASSTRAPASASRAVVSSAIAAPRSPKNASPLRRARA